MENACSNCTTQWGTVSVPDELSAYASTPAISYCPECLTVEPGEPADAVDEPSLTAIHRRFPSGTNGVGLLLLLGKLESLALNRAAIESLCAYLETNGLDLFLTLDRLIDDPDIEPNIDLSRRRTQLEQLLE